MQNFKLNDGNSIPAIGFGVFMVEPNGPTYDAVKEAIQAGYRHIDTAAAYFNEADVGKAVKDSDISREEMFITSKLWLQDYGYEAAKKGIDMSLQKLGIAGNLDIFDFELTDAEMDAIRALDTGKGTHDPEAPGVGEALLANYKIHD